MSLCFYESKKAQNWVEMFGGGGTTDSTSIVDLGGVSCQIEVVHWSRNSRAFSEFRMSCKMFEKSPIKLFEYWAEGHAAKLPAQINGIKTADIVGSLAALCETAYRSGRSDTRTEIKKALGVDS